MKKTTFLFLIAWYISMVFPAAANDLFAPKFADTARGPYKALIIGINYRNLVYPEKDAAGLAEILKTKYGFESVTLLTGAKNTTKANLIQAFNALAEESADDESVLIYYSGHGSLDQKNKDGWWIPSDANPSDKKTWISNRWLRDRISAMNARHVLLIADSCYAGTIFPYEQRRGSEITDKFYRIMYNGKSRIALTSAGSREEASDKGDGKNSVFADFFMNTLQMNKKPYMCIQELYFQFAPFVSDRLNQTPLCGVLDYAGHDGGQFVFWNSNNKNSDVEIRLPPTASFAEVVIQETPNAPWRYMRDGDELSSTGNYCFIFQPDQTVHFYLFQIDSNGKIDWVFPNNIHFKGSTGRNPVSAGKWVKIPNIEGKAFCLDDNIGIEHFYFAAAFKKWAKLEKMLADGDSKKIRTLVEKRLDGLVLERWMKHVKN